MKHDQTTSRDTFAIINVLADLAAEAQLIARVAADMDDPMASGISSIARRWYATLMEVSEALDDTPEGDRAGFSYYIAPADHEAPGPFSWIVADEATARVVAHGSAENWLAADAAAIAAIKELEAAQ